MQLSRRYFWLFAILLFATSYLKDGQATVTAFPIQAHSQQVQLDRLSANLADAGQLRVLVQLNLDVQPEGDLQAIGARQSQRSQIASVQTELREASQQIDGVNFLSAFETLPLVVMEVDSAGLDHLINRDDVVHVVEDELSYPSASPALESSTAIIGSDAFHSAGFDGSGTVIAVLDTGVDRDHIAFNTGRNRIIAEGCFSTESVTYGGVRSVCPNSLEVSTQPGSADDCVDEVIAWGLISAAIDCKHGTHVAGIIGANDGNTNIGVAPDVDLIPVQVFSAFDSYRRMLSFTSDQIKGLEYVLTLADQHNIVAVNMSLGGNYNSDPCDFDVRRQAIINLQSVGIATIIASGNEGYRDGVGKPGCISEAITVGATNDNDTVAPYSNISDQIDLLAPGSGITSTFPGNKYGSMSGTSMATPMVAGAFALFAESDPQMSIEDILSSLQEGGMPVDDQRSSATVTNMKRIDLASTVEDMVGSIDLKVESEPILFKDHAETISITLSNNSAISSNNIVLKVTAPSSFSILEPSISNEGVLDQLQTIIWKGLSVGPNEQITVSFVGRGVENGLISFKGTAIDNNQRGDQFDYTTSVRPLMACNSYEGFEDQLPALENGWVLDPGTFGQIRANTAFQANGVQSLALEDSINDGTVNLTVLEAGINIADTTFALLDLQWMGHGLYSAHADTGLFMSNDRGQNWFKIATPLPDIEPSTPPQWEKRQFDLSKISIEAGQPLNETLLLRLQFMGDGSINADDPAISSGLLIDDLQFNCGTPLVWDGEGSTPAWSDPRNWSPDLRPNGNDLRFDHTSPKTSEIDIEFVNPIGDLIISPDWYGTLTQTQAITVTGDYMQKSGKVVFSPSRPIVVGGSMIFIDGIMEQTKPVTTLATPFLRIEGLDTNQIKHQGIYITPPEAEQEMGDTTVTIAGTRSGESICKELSANDTSLINRCINIAPSNAPDQPINARIWLAHGEITSNHGNAQAGAGIGELTEPSYPQISLLTMVDGQWGKLDQAQLGIQGEEHYIDIEIDEAGLLAAQRVERVPTAVTLSQIQATSQFPKGLFESSLFVFSSFLLLITTYVGVIHKRKSFS